jgi:Ethanolamine utilization protein EutJ (predicted chaperonin)
MSAMTSVVFIVQFQDGTVKRLGLLIQGLQVLETGKMVWIWNELSSEQHIELQICHSKQFLEIFTVRGGNCTVLGGLFSRADHGGG